MTEEKTTNKLDNILLNTKPVQLDSYLKENREDIINDDRAFYHHFTDTLAKTGVKLKDVYMIAGETEKYAGKLIRMESHTKDRDKIIRFCLAGRFDLHDTNRALKLYRMHPLYSKDARDACIIVAINNREYDLYKLDDVLTAHGFKQISKED